MDIAGWVNAGWVVEPAAAEDVSGVLILDPVYADLYHVPTNAYGDDVDEFDAEGNPLWELKAANFPVNLRVATSFESPEGDKITFGETKYRAVIEASIPAKPGDVVRLRDGSATLFNVEGVPAGAGTFFGTKTVTLSSNV